MLTHFTVIFIMAYVLISYQEKYLRDKQVLWFGQNLFISLGKADLEIAGFCLVRAAFCDFQNHEGQV